MYAGIDEHRRDGEPWVLVTGLTNGRGDAEAVVPSIINEVEDEVDLGFVSICPIPSLGVAQSREVYVLPDAWQPIARRCALRRFFASASAFYDVLWFNCDHLLYSNLLAGAKAVGIPVRIAHAHNPEFLGGTTTQFASRINRRKARRFSTVRLACSREAGAYMFGTDDFRVLSDAIKTGQFTFSAEDRRRVRQALGIKNGCRCIGTVGRLAEQKNQIFLVRRLADLVGMGNDVHLVIVGEGLLKGQMGKYATSLGVCERVTFVGPTTEVASYLSAFDVFAFPSLFEGFGIAALEAQFNGLPVIASENVPLSVDVSTAIRHVPLNDECAWNDALVSATREGARLTEAAVEYNIHLQRPALLRLFSQGHLWAVWEGVFGNQS